MIAVKIHPFDDLMELLGNMEPAHILAFQPSKETIERIQELLEREQDGLISFEEKMNWSVFVSKKTSSIWQKRRRWPVFRIYEKVDSRPIPLQSR